MSNTPDPSSTPERKSTVEEIRARFDADVERFSDLETGQTAAMDSRLCLDLIAKAVRATTPNATSLLDVGCGAGNYTLTVLQAVPDMDVTLVDLSRPMLDRAAQRVSAATSGRVNLHQIDVREATFEAESFDVIVAAAVLHHLRTDAEWKAVYASLFRWLRPGGWLWVYDMLTHESPAVHDVMWLEYGEYLTTFRDEAYRDTVFKYIALEDSPRSLSEQAGWMLHAGFRPIEVLHKRGCFAAWGAQRPSGPPDTCQG